MHELLNEKVLTYNAWSIEGVEACMSSQWTFWQWTLWGNTFLQVFNNIKVARKDPVCSFEWRSVHETINLNKISQPCYPQTVHSPLFFPEILDVNRWVWRAAILVSWCERTWGEYMPVGRGGGGHGRQRKSFFRPFTPTLLTPPLLPTGILYSPQFCSHQETKMAARRTQRSTSTTSWKK